MCGRYIDPNLRGTEFELSEIKIDPFPRRYNIKPTQDAIALRSLNSDAVLMRWWFIPFWHKGEAKDWKATTFNARIEEAAKKPTFRNAWKSGRCLIPAGGYYEWTGEKGHKQPHVILSAGNEETLWFAGLSSHWNDIHTCAILTRPANACVEQVHNRMPVILNSDEREAWMGGTDGAGIGADAILKHHPVKRFGMRDDGPELVEEM
ncbi:SOS response-associated peptidase [Sedimentitalea nanhaiensis]|uniref:Abasic site processing protein n=1 Tax=Sedimentitalea nanhaiensis TaxID=999627 RepID=A0A1I7D515_9RHOB|nr:SOS response-associated peptidase [Sedimentitalea nanhaiensis]SFU06770.1 Putative SOS response-associated peptidase YedK [Sedimentitalea nanhaiensis]